LDVTSSADTGSESHMGSTASVVDAQSI